MTPLIPDGSVVFDIGANIGITARQFLDAGAGSVIAVEPCRENFNMLAQVHGITPIHAAAWNCHTISEVSFCWNTCGWSSCEPKRWSEAYPDAKWDKPQYVPAITLDSMVQVFGVPHLIKVDVEGCELKVLAGLSSKPAYVIFEFHGKFMDDARLILEMLRDRLGFEKANYVRENLDLNTLPTMPISEFIPRWINDAPEWGNITVT